MNTNEEFGRRLQNVRKQKQMSLAELGEKVNLHESTVKRYEDGGIKNVDIEKVQDFARALNTKAEYLLGWIEDPSTYTAVLDDEDIRLAARNANLNSSKPLQETLKAVIKGVLEANSKSTKEGGSN